MKCVGVHRVALLAGALAIACTKRGGERQSDQQDPAADAASNATAAYRDGVYGTAEGYCTLTVYGEERPRLFECGALLIGLQPGMRADSIADLLAAIAGTVTRDRPNGADTHIKVSIPRGTERSAILRILADRRVRYAEFNSLRRRPPD